MLIEVALPGVSADALEVSVQAGVLVVRGERGLPDIPGPAVIRRMELPHGRFERRIRLALRTLRVRQAPAGRRLPPARASQDRLIGELE